MTQTHHTSSSLLLAPAAPALVLHDDPFPGLTPLESAQAGMALSEEFADVLAATIISQGHGVMLTATQVAALVPQDWRDVLGPYAHGALSQRQADQRGIECKYVSHEGSGYHFAYRVKD